MALTEYQYYQKVQAEHPEAVILMLDYSAYCIFGDNVAKILPIVKEKLTHKYAGKMFCHSPLEYGYPRLSFGAHNLDKVLPFIIRAGYRVAITNYNDYRKTPEYKASEAAALRKWEQMREEEEKKKRQQPVQLSLYDQWFN